MVPPSFASAASRLHLWKRTRTSAPALLCPFTGAPAEFYFRSQRAISSRGFRFFFTIPGIRASQLLPALCTPVDRYSSDHSLSHYAIVLFLKGQIKTPLILQLFQLGRTKSGNILLLICQDFVVPPSFAAALRRQPLRAIQTMHLLPVHGGYRRGLLLAMKPVSSRSSRGLFHSKYTYGLSTSCPLSVCNKTVTRPCNASA